ncbi:MAG: YchJ family metal-binding protein [Myxococcota bacterium]|nr:YchJ family metal-binding protein [Myxococcota bacterium]
MTRASSPSSCPCGSAQTYASCCEPFHRGAEPPDPERLVRARFAAFACGEHAFLYRTLHPDHDDRARSERSFREGLAKSARRARYRALRILDRDGPDADGTWRVLFAVSAAMAGREASFVELSSFLRDDAGFRYIGGRILPASARIDLDTLTIARFLGL